MTTYDRGLMGQKCIDIHNSNTAIDKCYEYVIFRYHSEEITDLKHIFNVITIILFTFFSMIHLCLQQEKLRIYLLFL